MNESPTVHNPHREERRLLSVTVGGKTLQVPHHTPVKELLDEHYSGARLPALAAIVQNRCVDLTHPLCTDGLIAPVDYTTREGVLVYRRTASLLLLEAARRLYPGVRVSIGQALGNGYFYDLRIDGGLTPEHVKALQAEMKRLVEADLPLYTEVVSLEEAQQIFREMGHGDKVRLLQTYWEPFVTLVRCGEVRDIHHYPVAPSAGYINAFALEYYQPGLLVRFPTRWRPGKVPPLKDSPLLFATYRETRSWNEILGVANVGQLNALTVSGKAHMLIRVAEGLHEKKIARIADEIAARRDRVKLVLIAGPSSSGKTTFAKRLSLQLLVNGIRPVSLSTDNFYVNRVDTPRDDQGNYDFETIEAIDLPLFNDTLRALMRGDEVYTPRFDFVTGLRRPRDRWVPMKLDPGQILMVEGIHGLNERLTQAVPEAQKYKIYISALTQLCIDDHNRIFTSDTRFLRRIVRDRMFRGYSAAQTISTWPSVRRGEQKNIFPFQDHADVMFNSALVYEQAVLRLYAERFLLEVPQDHRAFVDAYRLLRFVQNFVPMFDEKVPQISLLREFVGGSAFKY